MCARAEDVLREMAALSDRLTLVTESEAGEGSLPGIRLGGAARGEVGFVGMPSGYEFPTFVDAIIDVSRGETSLSAGALERLAALGQRVLIQVFTTPT
jgi:alkyl hydroperoxide reductase subunit AhpF